MSRHFRLEVAFSAFLGSRFLSLLADQIALLAIPVAAYMMTGTVVWSGLALAIQWVPRIVLLPFLSRVVDLYPLRVQYLLVDSTRALLALLLVFTPSLALILLGAGVLSLLNGYAFVILECTVGTRFSRDALTRMQSRLQVIENLSRVLGPGIAGFALSAIGLPLTLAICSVLFVVAYSLGTIFFPHDIGEKVQTQTEGWLQNLRSSAHLLWSVRPLRRLAGLTLGLNFLDGVLTALMPALLVTRLGQSETVIGYLNSAGALTVILVMIVASKLASEKRVKVLGHGALAATIVAVSVVSTASSLTIFTLAYIVYLVANSVFVLYLRTERVRHIPIEHFGQVLGVLIAVILSAIPLSGLAVSLLSKVWSIDIIMLFSVMVASFVYGFSFFSTRVKK
ncbi:MFS transporter [Halomonas eurihalina]|nr:MFS transporter [Halomonas eurihalina]MDR5859269.1 MFS transporter [Halomonas eurihalina]